MGERITRRSNHVGLEASYGAIGTSQAEDLLKYPPLGSVPFEYESLLGSGEDRFVLSSSLLMTWGAQMGSGISTEVVETGDETHYRGADFTQPEAPQPRRSTEQSFAPDGTPYLSVGTVVRLKYPDGFEREMRVITVVDEPATVGFVMGTTKPQEIVGEEFFRVEQRSDGSVWAVVRGFYHQEESGIFGIRSKKRLKMLIAHAEDDIFALTPAGVAELKKKRGE